MRRVAIVGGGIGGLSAAIALRKIGFDVHVYEQSSGVNEAGSGMSLWPNAVKSLEQLDARVLDKLAARAHSLRRLLVKRPQGQIVKTLQVVGAGSTGIAVHRADLHSALADCLPAGSIHWNHAFTRMENRANTVMLYFENGASTLVDLAVGCDGIHSTMRKLLDLKCQLTSRPYTVWRGMTRTRAEDVTGYLKLLWDGDFSETYGNGRRFGIMSLSKESVHWYAVANNSLFPPDSSDASVLAALFSDWHAPISELIANSDSIIRSRVRDRWPSLPWAKGHTALLGDAAHPISPNFGQGACLAIEDAVVLGACLKSIPDISRALQLFQKSRYRRCLEILLTSREVGRFVQIQNRAFVYLRDQYLKLAPSAITTFWFRRSCEFQPPSLLTC